MAKAKAVDFTNVKEGGGFSKTHKEAGDYLAKVVKVDDKPAKDKTDMWCFTLQLKSQPSATYPYYCKLQENQLWKLRNLLVAAGINVPKKKIKVDPSRVVGKEVAISLEDAEYEGKMQSEINAIFPAADLQGQEGPQDEDDEDEDDDEEVAGGQDDEEEEEADEDEDEDDEDDEEEEPAPAPKKKAKASSKTKGKKKKPVDDDELDELEIDEL